MNGARRSYLPGHRVEPLAPMQCPEAEQASAELARLPTKSARASIATEMFGAEADLFQGDGAPSDDSAHYGSTRTPCECADGASREPLPTRQHGVLHHPGSSDAHGQTEGHEIVERSVAALVADCVDCSRRAPPAMQPSADPAPANAFASGDALPFPLPPAGRIVTTDANCPVKPVGPYSTNQQFHFLREIGGCSCLPDFLATAGAGGVLVIDEPCHVYEPLVLPERYTLMGLGPAGAGQLIFHGLPAFEPAIRFRNDTPRYCTIRDLAIVHRPAGSGIGFLVTGDATLLLFQRVIFQDWNIAILGHKAFSVYLERCGFKGHQYAAYLYNQTYGWHFNDCYFVDCSTGIMKTAQGGVGGGALSGDEFVVEACRFRNMNEGVVVGNYGTTILGNRFSGITTDIRVMSGAADSRVLWNHGNGRHVYEVANFDELLQRHHQRGFNAGAGAVQGAGGNPIPAGPMGEFELEMSDCVVPRLFYQEAFP